MGIQQYGAQAGETLKNYTSVAKSKLMMPSMRLGGIARGAKEAIKNYSGAAKADIGRFGNYAKMPASKTRAVIKNWGQPSTENKQKNQIVQEKAKKARPVITYAPDAKDLTNAQNKRRGLLTVYNPVAAQTDSSPRIGGFGQQMEFGDVALADRDLYYKFKDQYSQTGKDSFITIPALNNIKTPYGNGVFRVRDTMNKRYSGTGKVDVYVPPELSNNMEVDRIIRKQWNTPADYTIIN
jgi:hypothetical protein